MEVKTKNWGQVKGGKLSSGTTKAIKIPAKDEKLAELVGIILGDGNIQHTGPYQLRIVGDSIKDKDYMLNYVKPLLDSLFEVNSGVYKHYKFNAIYIYISSKKIIEFLISIGLKGGNKIESKVSIPSWILENNSYTKACIRGLVDTDGSIYELKPHWPGLWQICFTNKNEALLSDFRDGLIKVGIFPSEIYRYKNGKRTPKIYITKRSELNKFYEEIGFSNSKHSNKINPSKPKIL